MTDKPAEADKLQAAAQALAEQEAIGDALHAAVHPGHPWSGCANPDRVYRWVTRFRRALTPAGRQAVHEATRPEHGDGDECTGWGCLNPEHFPEDYAAHPTPADDLATVVLLREAADTLIWASGAFQTEAEVEAWAATGRPVLDRILAALREVRS